MGTALAAMAAPFSSVSVLDVGHGNSTVITHVDHVTVLDAGPGSALLEFLEEQGISDIDNLILSHADADHISGLLAVISSGVIRVHTVRLNTDSLKGSSLWDDLLFEVDDLAKRGLLDFRPSL